MKLRRKTLHHSQDLKQSLSSPAISLASSCILNSQLPKASISKAINRWLPSVATSTYWTMKTTKPRQSLHQIPAQKTRLQTAASITYRASPQPSPEYSLTLAWTNLIDNSHLAYVCQTPLAVRYTRRSEVWRSTETRSSLMWATLRVMTLFWSPGNSHQHSNDLKKRLWDQMRVWLIMQLLSKRALNSHLKVQWKIGLRSRTQMESFMIHRSLSTSRTNGCGIT